ncbi:MAG TPA: hydrogen gas-evolving membrane-bound hydrogenase subunit E [Pseudonocardia sp.]
MLGLVLAHLVLAGVLPAVAARAPRAAFAIAAVPPAAALVWALRHAGEALAGGVVQAVAWAPELGLALTFRLDALSLAMVVLVSGIGALVLVYGAGYFAPEQAGRNAALLLAFAGIMLGLVLADDLLTLYVFWELTSVASFLLVGQGGEARGNRSAAVQALLVTVLGGLVMLLGLVLLGEAAGTYRISEIVALARAGGLDGAPVSGALALVLVGALTKSAQLPFHPWLPAAMAAPTPVSAYLHAASMVKAGVYLVARLAPGFADRPVFWVTTVALGLATMAVGGWRALAQTDLKRLLAFGTVSQLGFLTALFGAGTPVAGIAGVAMLLAHGLFKAPLFLVTGIVDHATGTRDLRRLSGLGRSLPGTALIAVVAAASMAGLPPLLGFVAKEAALEAFVGEHTVRGTLVAAGLVAGSALTAAYSVRFVWGAFARKPGAVDTPSHRPGPLLVVPAAVCAALGVVLGLANGVVDADARSYAAGLPGSPGDGAGYHLAVWHGFTLPLLLSALAVGLGYAVHRARDRVGRAAGRLSPGLSAQRVYELAVSGVERLATVVTGQLQAGSVPTYLVVILLAVVALPGVSTVATGTWPEQPVAHSVLQVPLAVVVLLAALALILAQRRFAAVLLVGLIGYGVGGLFIVDGAPDLALAQFLVETLSLVAFVFVLRRLPATFTDAPSPMRVQVPKAVVATVAGCTVAAMAVVLSGARRVPATVSAEFVRLAPDGAGADNVVSAIIIDFRALDTIGEITVLFVAAIGVASLVLDAPAGRRRRRTRTALSLPDARALDAVDRVDGPHGPVGAADGHGGPADTTDGERGDAAVPTGPVPSRGEPR